jgi:hypothetical protein
MSGDRDKTAGEAAKEKVQRRKALKKTEKAADEAATAAGEAADNSSGPAPEDAEKAAARAKEQAAAAEQAAAEARPGDEADQRSSQEAEKDLGAGTVEPGGLKPTETDKAKSSEELRAEVEAAREQLAESVEELTDRVDPRPKIEDARRTAADNAAPIAGVFALLLVLIIWRRRRR